MNRSWVEKFYTECGREVSLAYNTFNHTNNWGITLATGIVGIVFIAAIRSVQGEVTIIYPNVAYWFVVILAWVIMTRFFIRSCLALVNMYRWNTLIYAASKLLSLPTDHPQIPIFERNFAKKVKAYFYEWHSPIPLRKLVWECFRLMYIWFFLILFCLVTWGLVALYGEALWPVGLSLFAMPTAWEIYSLLKWRGFRYQPLDLENEPDVVALWVGEDGAAPKLEINIHKTQNRLSKQFVISQALTYFVFGLLLMLAFALQSSRGLPEVSADTIWNAVTGVLRWLLVPIGGLAILWAIMLFIVTFNWKMVERLEDSRLQRIRKWNQVFYWPALVIVFGASFTSIWVGMVKADVSEPFLYIVFSLAIVVLLVLLVHRILSSRQ